MILIFHILRQSTDAWSESELTIATTQFSHHAQLRGTTLTKQKCLIPIDQRHSMRLENPRTSCWNGGFKFQQDPQILSSQLFSATRSLRWMSLANIAKPQMRPISIACVLFHCSREAFQVLQGSVPEESLDETCMARAWLHVKGCRSVGTRTVFIFLREKRWKKVVQRFDYCSIATHFLPSHLLGS